MTRHEDAERFAARLRALRDRADYSYEALAQKTGISRSSLHRYCAGLSIPQDYGVAHRIATVCGASPAELRELHRLWALSDAERAQRSLPEDTRDARGTGAAPGADVSTKADASGNPTTAPATGVTHGVESGGTGGTGGSGRASEGALPTATLTAPAAEEPGAASDTGEPGAVPAAEDPGADGTHRQPATDGTRQESRTDTDAVRPEPTIDRRPLARDTEPDALQGPPTARGKRFRRGRRLAVVAAVVAVAALGIAIWGVSTRSSQTKAAETDAERVLFSAACRPVLALGQQDECVKEAQRLLRQRGADIGVDGIFGPETRLRVTAFQVFAGITPNGVVADSTKKALYESKVRLETWSPEKVRGRIREVFTEAPADAVAIADCQSYLDPLYILPNTDGTRNWGLFQISDLRLQELGGTPGEALDPEWNIQAAKKLWSGDRDFRHWQCARALPQASPSRS